MARKNWGEGGLWLRDCPLLALSSPGNEGLQLAACVGGVSWPVAAGKAAHLGVGAWREAEMNYLCVLGEAIGHMSTLPATLELGSQAGGSSWGPGSRQSLHRGQETGSGRARERKPSLPKKEERAIFELRHKSR